MYKPIFVLAGQSNANTITTSVQSQLDATYGSDGYVLVKAAANGAPLIYSKGGEDWRDKSELQAELQQKTIDALRDNPDAVVEGFIWVQGEGDTYKFVNTEKYDARFKEMFADYEATVGKALGTRYTGLEDAQIVISSLSQNANPTANMNQWDEIIQEHLDLAASDSDITVVNPDAVAAQAGFPTGSMFRDKLHYSKSFSDVLAKSLVDAAGSQVGAAQPASASLPAPEAPPSNTTSNADDVFVINAKTDKIDKAATSGYDIVQSSVDFSLRAHSQSLEALELTGSADISGTGNGMDNVITGNSGDNILRGAWGDDTLIGGGGDDKMFGGRGDDTFRVDDIGDRVKEYWNKGHDTVEASVNFSLRSHSKHLEDLLLTGNADLNGSGNGRANVIEGNSGDNELKGYWGDDTLIGGDGADTLIGGRGDDTLVGGKLSDEFVVGSGGDHITDFELGSDRLVIAGQDWSGPDRAQKIADFMNENATVQGGKDLFIALSDDNYVVMHDIVDDEEDVPMIYSGIFG